MPVDIKMPANVSQTWPVPVAAFIQVLIPLSSAARLVERSPFGMDHTRLGLIDGKCVQDHHLFKALVKPHCDEWRHRSVRSGAQIPRERPISPTERGYE
jgi:hypothetical protein